MLRRLLVGTAAAAAVIGLSAPALAQPSGGGCELAGSAAFTPNGPGAQSTFGYGLTGTLSNCQSNREGAPTAGAVAVGQVVTVSVPITTSTGEVVQGTADYRQPLATGTGTLPVNSCAGSETLGTAVVTWPDDTTTVVDYTTNSVGPGVALQGEVVPSVDATLVPGSEDPDGTAPSTYTIETTNPTFPVGDAAEGLVAFTTDTPQGCTTDDGLSAVDVHGAVAVGSAS